MRRRIASLTAAIYIMSSLDRMVSSVVQLALPSLIALISVACSSGYVAVPDQHREIESAIADFDQVKRSLGNPGNGIAGEWIQRIALNKGKEGEVGPKFARFACQENGGKFECAHVQYFASGVLKRRSIEAGRGDMISFNGTIQGSRFEGYYLQMGYDMCEGHACQVPDGHPAPFTGALSDDGRKLTLNVLITVCEECVKAPRSVEEIFYRVK